MPRRGRGELSILQYRKQMPESCSSAGTTRFFRRILTNVALTPSCSETALSVLAEAQGRTLSDLLRGVTHDLISTFKAGQKVARRKAEVR